MVISCPHCGRRDFASEKGLTQHLSRSQRCSAAEIASRRARTRSQVREEKSEACEKAKTNVGWQNNVRSPHGSCAHGSETRDQSHQLVGEGGSKDGAGHSEDSGEDDDDDDDPEDDDDDAEDEENYQKDDDASNYFGQFDPDSDQEESNVGPSTVIRDKHKAFATPGRFVAPFEQREVSGVKLMDILGSKKAPLNSHQDVCEWHLRESGVLGEVEGMREASGRRKFIGREPLIDRLASRCGLLGRKPVERVVKLPSSKEVVKIPCNRAEDCILQLLTDPRIKDEDYSFFNNDPLAPPPDNPTHVGDVNTADAFRETYDKLCRGKKNKQLMGVIFYLDAAVTGQFSDLPVLALKMSLTIFTREARKKSYLWADLGYLPHVKLSVGRGKKIFKDSQHMEAEDIDMFDGEGEEFEGDDDSVTSVEGPPVVKAQDFHKMLDVVLESYVEIQETGFLWDQRYKGRTWNDMWYELFTPFIKADTEEADALCSKFRPRTRNIKQICRNCYVPMVELDMYSVKYPYKTKGKIKKLVDKGEVEQLRKTSQHCLDNAWHKIRFNLGNDRSVHGGTPCEKLHQIDPGIFPRIRNVFLKFVGSGQLGDDINGLATVCGKLFSHQSDRSIPPTNFSNGLASSKLMARECKGVVLITAAVLTSTKGRRLLSKKQKFKEDSFKDDWLMLVELLLQWETYLNEDKMDRKVVYRLKEKHKYLMYIIKKVAKRTEQMGLKIMKFHATLHMMKDILLCGVPMEFDTGVNESHHKGSKQAARLTQRNRSLFDAQVGLRLWEFLVLDLAMEETLNGHVNWECHNDFQPKEPSSHGSRSDSSSSGVDDLNTSAEMMDTSRQCSSNEDSNSNSSAHPP